MKVMVESVETTEVSPTQNPLVVVSNRLPIVVARKRGGGVEIKPGSGGHDEHHRR